MQVFALINLHTDRPYWVRREDFYRYFNQDDFNNRDVISVSNAYLKAWFHCDSNGNIHFKIPVVGACGDRTDLIGTRHRLAVLLPQLEVLPFAFALGCLDHRAKKFLESIPKVDLDPKQRFWIPDFPVVESIS